MPLQLGGIETERPKLVIWDPRCTDETLEAKAEIDRLKGLGFRLERTVNGEAALSPPEKAPNISVMRILNQNGDDRLTWDRKDPAQVKDAFKKFRELVKKGYQAFSVLASGSKGHRLDDFDPLSEEILMVPATVPG